MKKSLLLMFVFCTLFTTASLAQIINGDLNHNEDLDVEDITLLIDGYLSGEKETIETTVGPTKVNNSHIAGAWLENGDDIIIVFNRNGTFGGELEGMGYTYELSPSSGLIPAYFVTMYDNTGKQVDVFKLLELTDQKMTLKLSEEEINTYTRIASFHGVTDITLSENSLLLQPDDQVQLTASVYPADAENPEVIWTSSNVNVVTVSPTGLVEAVGFGVATITCTAADGGNVKATCKVVVTTDHEAVDLGLSVKWATMNIGANAPEEPGDYFAWGETEPKDYYYWDTYKWSKDILGNITKYNSDDDRKFKLDPEDDAANANWGGTWRMPTIDEFQELTEKCTWERTSLNGVDGQKVTGPNGNSIFLPVTGYRDMDKLRTSSSGYYWLSSLDELDSKKAWRITSSSSAFRLNDSTRYYGYPVRAVCP